MTNLRVTQVTRVLCGNTMCMLINVDVTNSLHTHMTIPMSVCVDVGCKILFARWYWKKGQNKFILNFEFSLIKIFSKKAELFLVCFLFLPILRFWYKWRSLSKCTLFYIRFDIWQINQQCFDDAKSIGRYPSNMYGLHSNEAHHLSTASFIVVRTSFIQTAQSQSTKIATVLKTSCYPTNNKCAMTGTTYCTLYHPRGWSRRVCTATNTMYKRMTVGT